jgi:putative membrane protein
MNLLKPILVTAITLFLLAWLIPAVSYLNWTTLLLASFVLTILQKIARPILNLLFLPINIVTLGFFSLVINVFVLWLATYLVPGFQIHSLTVMGVNLNQFWSLMFVSFLISFLQSIVGFIL